MALEVSGGSAQGDSLLSQLHQLGLVLLLGLLLPHLGITSTEHTCLPVLLADST